MQKQTDPQVVEQPSEHFLMWKGTPVREMLAVPLAVACKLLGIGRTSLWKEIGLGRIRKTAMNTIPRTELERYLAESIAAPA